MIAHHRAYIEYFKFRKRLDRNTIKELDYDNFEYVPTVPNTCSSEQALNFLKRQYEIIKEQKAKANTKVKNKHNGMQEK